MSRLPTTSTLFPYTTLFRSCHGPFNSDDGRQLFDRLRTKIALKQAGLCTKGQSRDSHTFRRRRVFDIACNKDRKSTRLNSSHANISYAVFCLKKKKSTKTNS